VVQISPADPLGKEGQWMPRRDGDLRDLGELVPDLYRRVAGPDDHDALIDVCLGTAIVGDVQEVSAKTVPAEQGWYAGAAE
jgi:hypothetical protein